MNTNTKNAVRVKNILLHMLKCHTWQNQLLAVTFQNNLYGYHTFQQMRMKPEWFEFIEKIEGEYIVKLKYPIWEYYTTDTRSVNEYQNQVAPGIKGMRITGESFSHHFQKINRKDRTLLREALAKKIIASPDLLVFLSDEEVVLDIWGASYGGNYIMFITVKTVANMKKLATLVLDTASGNMFGTGFSTKLGYAKDVSDVESALKCLITYEMEKLLKKKRRLLVY